VAGSQLFVIGHDACHGSLTASRLLNALIGRMAFVPSAHSFSLRAYFHMVCTITSPTCADTISSALRYLPMNSAASPR
jgi:hypothetical protein